MLARRPRRRLPRGNVIVLAAMLMVVLVGMVAFAIDIGYVTLVRAQLQVAADSAALAAADCLPDGPAIARQVAAEYAGKHMAAGAPVRLAELQDVELGLWDEETHTFERLSPSQEADADAVKVTCISSSSRGNPASLFFGRVFGLSAVDLSASAIAFRKSTPCGRIVGLDWVANENAMTDSYNSDAGAYSPRTATDRGHVCSNGNIENKSSGLIRGNATPGKGHTVFGGGRVTGSTEPAKWRIPARAVNPGDAQVTNDNSKVNSRFLTPDGSFLIQGGQKYTLPSGTYFFKDFTIGGQAQVSVSGPTVIYVTGNVDVGGKGMINSGKPADLTILSLGSTAVFRGSSEFRGSFYGPKASVQLAGTPALYGAVVGKTLTIKGDAEVHYDEALNRSKWLPKRVVLVQ